MKKIVYTLGLAFLAFSSTVLKADEVATEVATDGGIEVFRSNDDRYWFKLHGIAKVDAVFFMDGYEDRQNEFPSGTNVRAIETTFNGGIGKDLSYTISMNYENGFVGINDTFFTYSGFKDFEISIGQIISPFCLENANSGKWIPFLERSLPVIALRPCMGIGASMVTWGKHHALIIASATPPQGSNKDTSVIEHRSDKLTNTARFFYVPVNEEKRVFQLGVSGVYADNNPTFRDDSPNIDGRRFSTRPEARARNTPAAVDSGNRLFINYYTEWATELAYQKGPLLLQTEYLQADIHRQDRPNLTFNGWHAQAAYVLTGETRAYKIKSGSFGQVKPKCPRGAWEVAARYSMVDLNDEDVHGGKESNVSASLNWFVNENLLILANYIYASIDPTQAPGAAVLSPAHRDLNIFGLRAQIVW